MMADRQFVIVVMAFSAHVIACWSLQGNETDRLSLIDFKNAISLDPQQSLLSWNDTTHFCNWKGVGCRIRNPRRVTTLVLDNQGLVGEISPSLGNLTFLKHLFLPTNSFTGEIPTSLGHLHHLETLYLSNNTLQGRIPDLTNCSNLTVLWLDHNELAGQFPSHLPLRLEELQLSLNNLIGTLPASLANITTLNKFGCAHNTIRGNLPNDFGKFPVLELLYINGNQFAGEFPDMHTPSLTQEAPTQVYKGPITRNRAKQLQQEVHAFLSEFHSNINENYILPKSCTLMLLRFIQEETPFGYKKDAKAQRTMDTKVVVQEKKRDKSRTSRAPQKHQIFVQNCTISRGDVGHGIHGWKARQV